MRALFIGMGSIGQRHLQNYIHLRPNYNEILSYRTHNAKNIIKNGKIVSDKNINKYYNINDFSSLEEALIRKPQIAFICNPSSLHIDTAIEIANSGIHFFVEKPLGTSLKNLSLLKSLINKNKLINMIGYQSRFNPMLLNAKKIISSLKYGKVINAEFKWTTYLPDHHPYEDYRKSYAARKDLGGGVVFCLIHELDIIQWFFGLPNDVYATEGVEKILNLDVDENVFAIFNFKNDNRNFPLFLSLSFSQKVEKRFFLIQMQKAILECDLINNEINIIENKKNNIINRKYNQMERNDFFCAEIEEFISCVENNSKTSIPIIEGEKSLRLALAIHKSIKNKKAVSI